MTDISKRPLVMYHGSCYDGFTAAWVFRKFWGNDDIEFHPMNYGDEDVPDCKGRRVWVLDFSFPRDVMINKVIIPSIRTTVYDHHKTAEADLKGLNAEIYNMGIQRGHDKIVFDMHRSGAGITFDEMESAAVKKAGRREPRFNGQRQVRLVDYIEDRDLWNWKLESSQGVSAYISTIPMTFEAYDELVTKTPEEMTVLGGAILKYIDLFGDKACAMAHMRKIGGHTVPVINVPYMNCSDHIGKLAEQFFERKFAAGFFMNAKGQWQFGLRSRGENVFDVSEVAKQYGGGGHGAAAGFQVDTLPWDCPMDPEPEMMEFKPKDDSHKSMGPKMPVHDENPPDEEVDLG